MESLALSFSDAKTVCLMTHSYAYSVLTKLNTEDTRIRNLSFLALACAEMNIQ